ncbi:hypothetical protein TcasGA2_TC005017 [Tribolium castaneum]|uniref:Uncharacterized protein n=1 Tax=Tribolium castaneum TaxID=7070 RepID=D7EJL5_TRICA|nr:hypothetical protein TcasGA2_TC005017 [Tribolium castaneum]
MGGTKLKVKVVLCYLPIHYLLKQQPDDEEKDAFSNLKLQKNPRENPSTTSVVIKFHNFQGCIENSMLTRVIAQGLKKILIKKNINGMKTIRHSVAFATGPIPIPPTSVCRMKRSLGSGL